MPHLSGDTKTTPLRETLPLALRAGIDRDRGCGTPALADSGGSSGDSPSHGVAELNQTARQATRPPMGWRS